MIMIACPLFLISIIIIIIKPSCCGVRQTNYLFGTVFRWMHILWNWNCIQCRWKGKVSPPEQTIRQVTHRRMTVSYSWALLILNSQECPQDPNNRLLMPCPHDSTKCWTRVFLVSRMQIVAVQLLIHCFFLVLLSFLLKNMKYLHSKLNQWPNRPPRLLLLLLIFHNNDDQLTTCAVSETVLLTMDSRNCEILPGLPWTRPYHLDATTDSNWTLVNWIVSNAWPYY